MDNFTLSTTSSSKALNFSAVQFCVPSSLCYKRSRNLTFSKKPRKFSVFAAKDESSKLDKWDEMELKFGRMIGEDPKLTLAKIRGRKSDPEVSYMEIEKTFEKNKGKKVYDIEELPFDVPGRKKSSNQLDGFNVTRPVPKTSSSLDGLNLMRPVPKKGVKFEVDDKPRERELKRPSQPVARPFENGKASVPNVILRKPSLYTEADVNISSRLSIKPNLTLSMGSEPKKERFTDITLLKRPEPMVVKPDDEGVVDEIADGNLKEVSVSRETYTLLEKPNSSSVGQEQEINDHPSPNLVDEIADGNLKEGSVSKGTYSDLTLLEKPNSSSVEQEQEINDHPSPNLVDEISDGNLKELSVSKGTYSDLTLLEKPNSSREEQEQEINDHPSPNLVEAAKSGGDQLLEISEVDSGKKDDAVKELQSSNTQSTGISAEAPLLGRPLRLEQPVKATPNISREDTVPITPELQSSNTQSTGNSAEAPLLGRPLRLDPPVKATPNINREETVPITPERYDNSVELANILTESPIKEHEDSDWTRAEDLVKTGWREEVELISSSTRGFAVAFGSLVGFLPYRNLGAKWKFLAFESWLRRKGLDPSMYRQSLGIIGSFGATEDLSSPESRLGPQIDVKADNEISPDMKLDDLLKIYDQEKVNFLSSFIGQKIKLSVVLADRKSRKLIFSTKPKEKEELLGKKRSLMAKLSVGDVVKCCINKITYFGIFVEIDGVPALIHQTEVSWDATLDPASYFKIGQIVEAKVHQLDFSLERIFLSLKEITPDPLMETLEAVVGDHALDGEFEAAQADTEWAEVESLIQELQQFEGIQSVWKGRYFLSPGLAPTFQVYMAAMFEDQYKLLARSGNKIQEVMVQTSLSKEEMKSAILACTSRVV